MSSIRPSRRKKAETLIQSSFFTGRDAQIEDFRRINRLSLDSPERKSIWRIYGEGGIGKTTLLRRLRSIAEEEFNSITVYVDEHTPIGVVATMGAIAEQLEQATGESFKSFSERYKKYRQLQNEIEKDENLPKGFVTALGRAAGKFTRATVYAVATPIGVLHDATLGETFLEDQGEQFAQYLAQKMGNRDEVQLVKDPIKILTPLFVDALNNLSKKQSVVLFFDTYEITGAFLDQWLRELLEGDKYGELDLNTVVIIAGRDEPGEEWSNEYILVELTTVRLHEFDETEVADYILKKRGSRDQKAIDFVYKQSGGLPMLVVMLTDILPQDLSLLEDPKQIASLREVVIDRFLKWLPEDDKESILLCAIPRLLNRDLVELLLGEEKAHSMFKLICSQTFVRSVETGWVYHDIVRPIMLQHLRIQSPKDWRQLNTILIEHYRNRFEELGLEISVGITNDSWLQAYVNWLYHSLLTSEKPVQLALMEFLDKVDTARKFIPEEKAFITVVSNTLSQVGHLLKLDDIIELGTNIAILGDNKRIEDFPAIFKYFQGILPKEAEQLHIMLLFHRVLLLKVFKEFDTALPLINEAVKLAKDHTYLLPIRAEILTELSRYQEAMVDINTVLEKVPDNAFCLYTRGYIFFKSDQYDKALADYNKAFEIDPSDSHILILRGILYAAQEQRELALADLNKVVSSEPDNISIVTAVGNLFNQLQWYEDAILVLSNFLKLSPNRSVLSQRGVAYYKLGRYELALSDFEEIIKSSAEVSFLLLDYAIDCYRNLARYQDALNLINEIVLDDSPDHWNVKGLLLNNLNQYQQAIESFQLAPDNYVKNYNIAVTVCYWKGLDAALPLLESVHSELILALSDEELPSALYGLGGLAAVQGKVDDALAYLRQASDSAPEMVLEWAPHDIAWRKMLSDKEFQHLISSLTDRQKNGWRE